jgi:hypothetical protein
MLSADNSVRVTYEAAHSGPGWMVMHINDRSFRLKQMHRAQFRSNIYWSNETPQRVARLDHRTCWMFRGRYFWTADTLSQHQVRALLEPSPMRRSA